MGSLYHLGQKLVDFANIITRHANRNDTVPSSSLVYKGAKNIATIEDSNVASKAYSVGEFLILDGQLYRVTNAIAQGGTITVGTNVTLDSVGSELKSLNDSFTNSVWVQSGSTAIRTNSRKSLMLGNDTAVTVWDNSTLLYYLACVKNTGWGTSLSVTVHNNNIHGFLLISGDLFVVWMPSTSDINVTAYVTGGIFKKSGQGSCTFGPASSSSIYKLVRNGNTFTFTSSNAVAIAWIGTT